MDASQKPVVTFYKPVVIDVRLRELVHMILLAPSPTAPTALDARRRLRAMVKPATAYLFATEIQTYLDAMNAGGLEARVFPIVGDLFLDALEVNLSSMRPNFFKDHYTNIMWCFERGQTPTKAVQGALYCVDLVIRKIIELFLTRESAERTPKAMLLSFQKDESLDFQSTIGAFVEYGRQSLRDAVESAMRITKGSVTPAFIDYVVDLKGRLEITLSKWDAYHRRGDLRELTDEQYLAGAASVVEATGHTPAIAVVYEYQVMLREQAGVLNDSKIELEQGVHPIYNAAAMYLAQGNIEREADASDLAVRRYAHAAALFTKINDRTSTAKAHMEKARVFIKSGDDPGALRQGLVDAIGLILAHMKNMPKGAIPEVSDDQAIAFLRNKGYTVEADAYEAALPLLGGRKSATNS